MLPTGSPSSSEIPGIGNRRISHQQLKESLPAPGKAGEGRANRLGAFLGEQAPVNIRLMGGDTLELGVIVYKHDLV